MAHRGPVLVKEKYTCWGKGRRGLQAPVSIAVYENAVEAEGEYARLTEAKMRKILKREFPNHTFYFRFQGEYLKADADRWTGDGILDDEAKKLLKDTLGNPEW